MTKFLTSLMICMTALPVLAALPERDATKTIVIEVAPEDLERCRETLAQVMMSPLTADQPIPANMPPAPNVTCVARH